jgi:hypothetical protein
VKLHPIAFCGVEQTTPHIVNVRGAALRIAFRRWRIWDRALQFNNKARANVAAIAAAPCVID